MGAPGQAAVNQKYGQSDMHSSPCAMGAPGQFSMTSPYALTDAFVQSCGNSYDPQFPPMAASQPAVYHSEVSGPMTDQPGDKAGANAALGFTPTNFGDWGQSLPHPPSGSLPGSPYEGSATMPGAMPGAMPNQEPSTQFVADDMNHYEF
ncbi:unnamed protein product [Cladocopium goreaui]|uniref:Uncharacterized protein n=1 Tax=Cladocopium goreaui TaxID=2562237 RepID=A0A9P1CRG2_9DINO|nr:unnamed protein product [Cladocopium goreaui]